MSTISAGLAATIREWFSEGDNVTAVEEAEKVDLEKVKLKRKPRRKAPKKEEQQEQVAAQPEAPEPVETQVQEQITQQAEPQPEPQIEIPKPEPVKQAEPAPQQQVEDKPKVKKDKPVIPAGPMLEKPAPAKLAGPKVVRFEKPEPEVQRKPRPPRPRFNEPTTEPLMGRTGEAGAGEKGKDTKKRKSRTHGRRKDEADAEATRRAKYIAQRRERDLEERQARLTAATGEMHRLRPTRKIEAKRAGGSSSAPTAKVEKLTLQEPVTVKSLSAGLAVKATDVIAKLMQQGILATANQAIANDVAQLVAIEFGAELHVESKPSIEDEIKAEFENRPRENLKKRPVVATMLGHVDHGKTSLLDKIRSTQVQAGEAGGITQHIGASQVEWQGHTVTFLDTPGHEAFTAMRARGANMTDVVVLVVAADDGVMPQTVEAINHAKAAGVPVLVALNKIDLPGIDINRIYSRLSELELAPTEWSGQTEVVKTSATTGQGINDLLEHLDYISELLELKADDTIPATGWVVEAKMDSQRGPVATLLLKEGKLEKGDIVLAGSSYGRVKMIRDSMGKIIKTAVSSMPVEIIGLNGVPQAGDRFYVLDDLNRAKLAVEENIALERESSLAKRTQVTMDNLFSQIEAGNVKELNIIIRADVQGSVDVLNKYLSELSTDEVKIKIIHAAPGGITEGDIVLAEASNALIIGFNVVAEEAVAKDADEKGVDIRLYSVIYRITEDLHKAMVGLLEPEEKESVLGRAVVRNTFKVSKIGTIAGCYVTDGVAAKNAKVRLIRDSIVIRDDLTIFSLKHFKDDAREVKAGLECGVKLAKFDDVKLDDVLEFYEIVKVARTL
jgi:translation initiation factor IF-2